MQTLEIPEEYPTFCIERILSGSSQEVFAWSITLYVRMERHCIRQTSDTRIPCDIIRSIHLVPFHLEQTSICFTLMSIWAHYCRLQDILAFVFPVPRMFLRSWLRLPDHFKIFQGHLAFCDYWNFTSCLHWIFFRHSGAAHIVETQLFLNSFFLFFTLKLI